MAAPTEAQALATLQDEVLLLDEHDKWGGINSTNHDGLDIAARVALKGDRTSLHTAQLDTLKGSISAPLTPDRVVSFLTPAVADFVEAVGGRDRGFDQNLVFLRDYWVAQSDTFNSREMTFGTPSAGGGNVGSGVPLRLTVGPDDEDLEGAWAEQLDLVCDRDQKLAGGRRHSERFRVEGAYRRAWSKINGSGLLIPDMKVFNPNDTGALLRNPSFSQFSGTLPTTGSPATPASTTAVTGWVLSSAANFRLDADTVHDSMEGDTRPYSLQFVDNGNVSQVLALDAPFDDLTPYPLEIEVYRESNCDGNFRIDMGAVNQTFAMSGLTNGQFNTVKLDLDKDVYYRNFKEDLLNVIFTLSSRSTGTIFIDSIRWGPMQRVGGTWLRIPAGATPFLRGDAFTISDSAAVRANMIYWLFFRTQIAERLQRPLCPPTATGAAETIADAA